MMAWKSLIAVSFICSLLLFFFFFLIVLFILNVHSQCIMGHSRKKKKQQNPHSYINARAKFLKTIILIETDFTIDKIEVLFFWYSFVQMYFC